jgi:carboxymethylenebutenolidase
MNEPPELPVEEVVFPSGGESIRGALVRARPGAPDRALVLIHDVHGLSELYRRFARRFAARGLSTLAIDLYSREGAPKLSGPEEALRWIAELPDPRILADIQAAVDWLRHELRATSVGVTGFCMGGQYALLAACTVRGLDACVSFYGMLRYRETNERKPRSPLAAAPDLSCPYLGIFGEEDVLIPSSDVAELRELLARAAKRFEIRTYPGCGHAFLNETRPDAYRPDAARDAFERAVGFFLEHLPAASR